MPRPVEYDCIEDILREIKAVIRKIRTLNTATVSLIYTVYLPRFCAEAMRESYTFT